MKTSLKLFGAILALLISGCFSDAPRDNPVESANGVTISGKVEKFYETTGLAGAMIRLKPGNLLTLSDGAGNFRLQNVPPGSYTVVCSLEGFRSDSLVTNLQSDGVVNFKLDGLPFFTNISLTTHHISRFFPPDDDFFVRLEVTADDRDNSGDVQLVRYQIPALGFSDTLLQISPQTQTYAGQANLRDLGITALEQLTGKAFIVYVEDVPGASSASAPQFITRIISTTPQTQSPGGTVTPPFDFRWMTVQEPYPFTFTIEIFLINFAGVPVDRIEGIPGNSSLYSYTRSLDPDDYFWVIYIVDEFGNRSRSRQRSFTIP